jgi:hypothetical protein
MFWETENREQGNKNIENLSKKSGQQLLIAIKSSAAAFR